MVLIMPHISQLTVVPGVQIVGTCQQRVSYREKLRAVDGTLPSSIGTPRTMSLTFFSFLITGVPSFRPRTPAIPGIYLFSDTG